MAPAPGSHTQKTIWAPRCRLNLRREQAPLLLTGRRCKVHTGAVAHTHMQSNAVGHTHPDHCGNSHRQRPPGYEETATCGHTHAHLQTITRAHRHAHRHPNPPILRHPHRCLAGPEDQVPPPSFRSRWGGLGFEGAPPPPSLRPQLSKVHSPRGLKPAPPPNLARGATGEGVGDGKPGLKLF